ncbi:MAG: farnesyl-diphosphate synthase, partial [Alteromonadaceae bacterium]|nr:farnesyl-diphosphate synthase [Alteromonadaceae bacterium]
STYVSILGLEGAQQEANALLKEALHALAEFGEAAEPLRALARKMVHRDT